MKSKLYNASLERGLSILELFDAGHRTLGLAQIVEMTGMDKSAVQRFTQTLVGLRYLNKDAQTRRYSLSPRLLRLGSSFLRGNPLIERATPYMLNCNRETSETINLSVLDSDEVTMVARIPGREVVSPNVGLGSSFPWHNSVLGQVIGAYLPRAELEAMIDRIKFVQYTRRTITTAEKLRERIEQIRQSGIVMASSEIYEGDISVAAPIFDYSGQVVAAVSIVVLESSWTEEKAAHLKPVVRELANAISSRPQSPRVG
jgi:DNA-binding IclR family transcriptional regulator